MANKLSTDGPTNGKYRFAIDVAIGTCFVHDNASYISTLYDSFEDCYDAYIRFDAFTDHHFSNVLHVVCEELIYYGPDDIEYSTYAEDGTLIEPISNLGLSRKEIDAIVTRAVARVPFLLRRRATDERTT